MSVVVLGEASRVAPWALSGATVLAADDPQQVRDAWAGLADAAVVLLTPAAAAALDTPGDAPDPAPGRPRERVAGPMTVVLP